MYIWLYIEVLSWTRRDAFATGGFFKMCRSILFGKKLRSQLSIASMAKAPNLLGSMSSSTSCHCAVATIMASRTWCGTEMVGTPLLDLSSQPRRWIYRILTSAHKSCRPSGHLVRFPHVSWGFSFNCRMIWRRIGRLIQVDRRWSKLIHFPYQATWMTSWLETQDDEGAFFTCMIWIQCNSQPTGQPMPTP